jgi:propanol-preferring alcohol dehydrogenase
MKAMQITEFGKPLAPAEVDTPKPSGSSVLVKVAAAGVCHTDLHLVSGGYDLGDGKFFSFKDGGLRLPVTPGHEISGLVAELGGSYNGTLKQGDPVIVYPWIGCGECRKCMSGTENLCEGKAASLGFFRDGGYAEYVLVPNGRYAVKSEGIRPEQAATLSCMGLTVYNALKRCRLMSDDLLVVIGVGGLGTLCVQLAKRISGARVAAIDVEDSKLEQARGLGAEFTINTSGASKGEIISELRKRNSGRGADAVVDFVGNSATASLGFDLLGRDGRLGLVGLVGGATQFALPRFPIRGVEIMGIYTGTLRDMAEMIDMTRRGIVAPVIAGKFRLEEANDILERLRAREILGRAVLIP